MKIISHRGNIRGPVSDKENRPSYIDCAIGNGYDVEIDVRLIEGELWLGHDEPQYKIDHNWLDKRRDYLWLHCKNIEALLYFKESGYEMNYFWHQEDDFTLTSQGYIWTYPGKDINKNSIVVMPERVNNSIPDKIIPYGVCTDFCLQLSKSIK